MEKLSIWITLPERSSDFSDGIAVPRNAQPRVNVVLDHRHLIARGEFQQAAALGERHAVPVGLWKSGVTKMNFTRFCISTVSSASRSSPT